ncbi:MAG: hypothetical protein ACK5AZ_08315 [Bryobacteraceae bacterium]
MRSAIAALAALFVAASLSAQVETRAGEIEAARRLAKTKATQPEAGRALLTGHADKQSAIQAISDI